MKPVVLVEGYVLKKPISPHYLIVYTSKDACRLYDSYYGFRPHKYRRVSVVPVIPIKRKRGGKR